MEPTSRQNSDDSGNERGVVAVVGRIYIAIAALFLAIELWVAWTTQFSVLFWLIAGFVVVLAILVPLTNRNQAHLRNGALLLSLALLCAGLVIIDRAGRHEYVVWMFLYIPLALGLAGYRRGRWWILAYLLIIASWLAFGQTSIPGPVIRETLLAFAIVLMFSVTWQIATEVARRELKLANARLDRLARFDALTGLLNRRAVEEHLQYELRRLERFPGPLSVMLIDLDDFKQINDRYGHLAGDAVLRGVAAELRKHLRDTDITGRWGGDEFLILLPGTDEETAKTVLDRLQQNVGELIGPGGETPHFSAGVATTCAPTSADALIAQADAQLYAAKETTRHPAATRDRNPR